MLADENFGQVCDRLNSKARSRGGPSFEGLGSNLVKGPNSVLNSVGFWRGCYSESLYSEQSFLGRFCQNKLAMCIFLLAKK